jgi:hypothetical protein
MLGLTRTHARFLRNATPTDQGIRVYETKAFYRGQKVTVIGAISIKEIVALMTINNSMDSQAFKVFIEHFLLLELWPGAVVVMDI